MLRVAILAFALLVPMQASAQSYYYNPMFVVMPGSATLPPSCASGDRYFLTSDSGVYVCGGNNVWAKVLTATSVEMAASAAWGAVTGTLSNQTDLQTALNAKQATLVSATNIKTINGATVLGSGDLTVGGGVAWGGVTGTLSNQTDLQTALNGKQASGSYATGTGTANGTNTGDQTSIVGITGTLAQFNTALTGADFTTGGGTASGTNTGDQASIVGITGTLAQFNTAITDADMATGGGTATGTNTGDQTTVSGNAGTATTLQNARTINGTSFNGSANITLGAGSVTLAQQADIATASLVYRKTAGSGAPEVNTLATVKTDLALVKADVGLGSVDNTADSAKSVASAATLTTPRTINGTSFNGSANITLGNASVTLAQMADVATSTVFYRKTAATGVPEVQTLATLKTDLGLTGTNSGDQTITLTGDVTGTGTSSFATTFKTSPSFTTPVIGVATGTSLAVTGALTSSGTAGVGYTTGAGGAVTQLTSKATATPAINKPCGTITMNAAALAAAAIVSFVVTNNIIGANDVVIVQHDSAGTFGAYYAFANTNVAATSFKITVKNISAGSLSEAIVLRFCIVKGAVS